MLFALERGLALSQRPPFAWFTVAYSLVLVVWATAFIEAWKRRQAELSAEWDVAHRLRAEGVRAEFSGQMSHGLHARSGDFVPVPSDMLPDDAEAPLIEMVPPHVPRRRMACSALLISCLLGVTVIGSLALLVLRVAARALAGTGGTFAAAAANAAFAEAMGFAYKRAARSLTAWENHRTHEAHRSSLIVKLGVFSFTNRFFASLYIAFAKGRRARLFGLDFTEQCRGWDGLPSATCMDELRAQVIVLVLLNATLSQLSNSLLPHWQAARARTLEARARAAGEPRPPRAAAELLLAPAAELFAEYNELMLDFAAATLFASAFPLTPLFVIANNLVDLRADGVKTLFLRQRPFARAAAGVGVWVHAFDVVGYMAIFTNLGIMIFTADALGSLVQLGDADKLLLLVALEHAAVCAKFLLAAAVPDVPARALNAAALRDFLARAWVDGERASAKGGDEPWARAERTSAARAAARRFGFRLRYAPGAREGDGEGGGDGRGACGQGDKDDDDDDDDDDADDDGDEPKEPHARAPHAEAAAAAVVAEEVRLLLAHGPFSAARDSVISARASLPPAVARRFAAASGVPWSPALELAARAARASSTARRRACTDAPCVLLLVALLALLTLCTTAAAALGRPTRLVSGVDYGLDVCGADNGGRRLDGALIAGASLSLIHI